jgi:hypothetical protein
MKGVRTEVPGVVIQATTDSVQLAVSQDAQQTQSSDLTVKLTKPPAISLAQGASVKYVATFDSYTRTPPMIYMTDGEASGPGKKVASHRSSVAQSTSSSN